MKRLSFVLFILISALILDSCVLFSLIPKRDSETFVFDESLKEGEYALIHYEHNSNYTFNGRPGLAIIEYNGMTVNWEPPRKGSIGIKIPGGNTRFILNGRSGIDNTVATYDNIPFVFNFENGKEYTIIVHAYMVYVSKGRSTESKDTLAYDMRGGQKLLYEYGKRVK